MKRTKRLGMVFIILQLFGCSGLSDAPGKDKIQADLVERTVCGWYIDSISNFRELDVSKRAGNSEIAEYDLHVELERQQEDAIIDARAVYKKRGGDWLLSSFSPSNCTSTREIAQARAEAERKARDEAEKKRIAQRFTDNGDGTVTDNETGLMWRRCAEGLSGEDCSVGEGIELNWGDAIKHGENTEFAGYDDWRLPDRDELLSLVNKSYRPTIYPKAFPHASAKVFWTASTGHYPYWADGVDFSEGRAYGAPRENVNQWVRLVRFIDEEKRKAEDKRMAQRFTDNGDGTVLDQNTGLMWKRCAEGLSGEDCTVGEAIKLDWEAAIKHGENAEFAGYDDWRLPDKDELLSLANKLYRPTIYPGAFPHAPFSLFWSASPDANDSTSAWYIDFSNGRAYDYYRDDYKRVRLVRSGQ